jgi:PhnB protein
MPTTDVIPSLVALLVVRNAPSAIEFYVRALGAREIVRYLNNRQGTVSHADLAIGDAVFSLTEEARAWNSDAPPSLGGSPVVLQLRVENVDAAFEKMCTSGATAVFPIVEFCGERLARLRDPFGHLWILSQRIEELSQDEVQRRRDAWTPPRQLVRS